MPNQNPFNQDEILEPFLNDNSNIQKAKKDSLHKYLTPKKSNSGISWTFFSQRFLTAGTLILLVVLFGSALFIESVDENPLLETQSQTIASVEATNDKIKVNVCENRLTVSFKNAKLGTDTFPNQTHNETGAISLSPNNPEPNHAFPYFNIISFACLEKLADSKDWDRFYNTQIDKNPISINEKINQKLCTLRQLLNSQHPCPVPSKPISFKEKLNLAIEDKYCKIRQVFDSQYYCYQPSTITKLKLTEVPFLTDDFKNNLDTEKIYKIQTFYPQSEGFEYHDKTIILVDKRGYIYELNYYETDLIESKTDLQIDLIGY